METYSCQINLRVHYQTRYGDSLYIQGDFTKPHQWHACSSIRMQWQVGDYWVATLNFSEDDVINSKIIQYKYCVNNYSFQESLKNNFAKISNNKLNNKFCEDNKDFHDYLHWERGSNRKIQLEVNSLQLLLEYWDYQELTEMKKSISQLIPTKPLPLQSSNLNQENIQLIQQQPQNQPLLSKPEQKIIPEKETISQPNLKNPPINQSQIESVIASRFQPTSLEIANNNVEQLEQISKESFQKLGLPAAQQLQVKSLLDTFSLNMNLFDPRYNKIWNAGTGTRGQIYFKAQNKYVPHQYNFPAGYIGYGLNVSKWRTGKDQTWLGKDSNAWIILYHGTGKNQNSIKGILNDSIQPGYCNGSGGSICRITNEKIQTGPVNTYLTDSISMASGHAPGIAIGGKRYQLIFQCRVNPLAVRSPQESIYTVEGSKYDPRENIRPYRLLIKQC